MTVWMLQQCGFEPGFLVGGVVPQLAGSANLGNGEWFVVEADEYDTAFFDKRSKFVHYRPDVVVLNNLEFDHADIFDSLADIEWQFHQLMRIVPRSGSVVVNVDDPNLPRVLERGCWTPQLPVSSTGNGVAALAVHASQPGEISTSYEGQSIGSRWLLHGAHNRANSAAALGACISAGADLEQCVESLSDFRGVKRRMEALVRINGAWVYDDFAHHPTAIRVTISAVTETKAGRVIVVFEPRSSTMRSGTHGKALVEAFADADELLVFSEHELAWNVEDALSGFDGFFQSFDSAEALANAISDRAKAQDVVVLMSNGALGGLRERLVAEHRP